MTNSQAIDTGKDTPRLATLGGERPGLAAVLGEMPFDMPPAAGRIFLGALEREQWLQRLGLYGIVTGIATHDLREFGRACDRLVECFKSARAHGRLEGARDERRRWVRLVGVAAGAGVLVGLAAGTLLAV